MHAGGRYADKGKVGEASSPYSSVTNSGDAASAYQRMPRAPPVMCTCSADAAPLAQILSQQDLAQAQEAAGAPLPRGRPSVASGVGELEAPRHALWAGMGACSMQRAWATAENIHISRVIGLGFSGFLGFRVAP